MWTKDEKWECVAKYVHGSKENGLKIEIHLGKLGKNGQGCDWYTYELREKNRIRGR